MGRWKGAALSWPMEQWPESDRTAWTSGCVPSDPFDDPRYGGTLRPASLAKTGHGYGRWLCFLESRGWLDPAVPAFGRVTRRRLRAYFHELRRAGNADYTIIGRFQELEMALKILAPGQDTSWVRRPDGVSIYALLPKAKRHLMIPDSGVLFEWGLGMMNGVDPAVARDTWRTTYRDGLLIAMLAARGRRRKPMAGLRIGKELVRSEDRYRIELTTEQVKTHKVDRFNLPERLTPYVQHYLDVIRPGLLKGGSYDDLWISRRGTPLTVAGLEARIFRLSLKRFGQWFGPHRFRHAIATTLALRDPGNPGMAAAMLGISAAVAEEHYKRRPGQIQASRTYAQLVEQRKRQLGRP